MLELTILGFLYEAPLHAYGLRSRISGLTGHIRPVSDGALYPALTRLQKGGPLTRRARLAPSGRTRQMLTLTAAGRRELLRRLAEPTEVEITDRNAFNVLLAFLGHLKDPTPSCECSGAALRSMAGVELIYDAGHRCTPRR